MHMYTHIQYSKHLFVKEKQARGEPEDWPGGGPPVPSFTPHRATAEPMREAGVACTAWNALRSPGRRHRQKSSRVTGQTMLRKPSSPPASFHMIMQFFMSFRALMCEMASGRALLSKTRMTASLVVEVAEQASHDGSS